MTNSMFATLRPGRSDRDAVSRLFSDADVLTRSEILNGIKIAHCATFLLLSGNGNEYF